jgi:hypothetical protein
MVSDLVVESGQTVVLDENPPPNLGANVEKLKINTLNDLVGMGIISSQKELENLISSAKKVTTTALTSSETFTPFVNVTGTTRPDLKRFGSFMASSPSVKPTEINTFWRIVRTVDPVKLESITAETDLSSIIHSSMLDAIGKLTLFNFKDVTVESNGVLEIHDPVQVLRCNDLLIKKYGRIVVKGSGVVIKAHSIKGEKLDVLKMKMTKTGRIL